MLASFRWILPRHLAGSGRPGLLGPVEIDLEFLRASGIRTIVSLTETPLDPSPAAWGMQSIHFPIDDMGIPTPRDAHGLCQKIVDSMTREGPVLLHCKAGLGRTGTMLACTLVHLGHSPEHAVARLRALHPGYIQTPAQHALVGHYAEHLSDRNEVR